jgi:DNA helicase IV
MYRFFEQLFFKTNKFFYHKLSDSSMWYKPYDAIMTNKNWTYHIEYKLIKKIKEDVYKSLRPQQKFSLETISNFWWNSIVVVYHDDIDEIIVYEYWKRDNKLSLDFLTQG